MCIACHPGLLPFLKQGSASRRRFLKTIGALGLAAALPDYAMAADGSADMVFVNGAIITMDDKRPLVEAVAVRGGRILAAGSLKEVERLKGSATQVVDLAGKTMLPGFVEPHIHCVPAFLANWLDIGPFVNQSMDEVRTKITRALAAAKCHGVAW
jgi:predicted amidohydrolase YtcJ